MFTNDRADYEKMPASPEFRAGLAKLIAAAERYELAAMCSEADPLDCHRCLLVGRAVTGAGLDVGHILASGEIIAHTEIEDRLLKLEHFAEPDLLMRSREERLAEAYRSRNLKRGYTRGRRPLA